MAGVVKSMWQTELQFYSNSIFALRGRGPLKWWVTTESPSHDIFRGKFAGFARVRKVKTLTIKIPMICDGKQIISPAMIFSKIQRSDLFDVDAYSVKILKKNVKNLSSSAECDAEVTLHKAKKKPKALILRKPNLNLSRNKTEVFQK